MHVVHARRLRLAAALLSLGALAARAEPAKLSTLAIAQFDARAGATPDQAALAGDFIVAQLVSDGRLRVVERAQLAKVMKEQALASSGVMSDEVQVKVAQLVGAQWLAVGSLQGAEGRSLVLALRAIDSSSASVVYSDTLKIGDASQLEPGARKLARALSDKLLGPGKASAANDAPVGDFDATQVKDGARAVARSLAMRFPKVEGSIVEFVPNGTATCRFASVASVFAGQRFEIAGRDDVTESEVKKGFFLLGSISASGCSGRVKQAGGADIAGGDKLRSLPLKISIDALEAASGAEPVLGKLFTDELRAALGTQPQFAVATSDAQVTALGRVTGARGRRTVQLQIVDKQGNQVQTLELPGSF